MSATTRVALLRAINVGGQGKVAMAELRAMLESIGLTDVRSLLQTGNIVFRGGQADAARLERTLAAEASARLGLRTEFFVRTAAEWRAIIAANPFREEAARDPARLIAMFLSRAPSTSEVSELHAAIVGREVVHVDGRQAYLVYPEGMGRSRLTTALIERTLRARGTARNWNTVRKLEAMVESA